MRLSDKLRELRAERGLTQEAAAEYLGVSAQTVSKWERGLLSPDIHLLPRLAVLYEISLDALFDVNALRADVDQERFWERLNALHAAGDREGAYDLLLAQIELVPDYFDIYPDLLLHVRRQKLLDEPRILRMVRLADYADRHCRNDYLRNEIHMHMAHICHASADPRIHKRAKEFLGKLPAYRHNRETQAPLFLEGEERELQIKWNVLRHIDGAECALRLLIREDMSLEEQLTRYRHAVSLYDSVLSDGYGGLWDPPRVGDHHRIVRLLLALGRDSEADEAMERILAILRRHALPAEERVVAPLVPDPAPKGYARPEDLMEQTVRALLEDRALERYHEAVRAAWVQDRKR